MKKAKRRKYKTRKGKRSAKSKSVIQRTGSKLKRVARKAARATGMA
jgi:hypothetical protein